MKNIVAWMILFLWLGQLSAQTDSRGVGVSKIQTNTTIIPGNLYAVIVGVSNYKYIRPLSFADQDALLFQEFLQSKSGGSVKSENILLLLNQDANASTQPRIRHWLLDSKRPKKGDRVYFYFAGHGDAIDADEYFFLLQDCNPGGDKNNYTGGMASVLQMYNIKSFIKNYLTENGVQVIFIWDACRTNELPGGENGLKTVQEGIAEKNNGELIMLSASSGEVAIENNSYAHGHGLFTYYLIDGLSGEADKTEQGGNNDGKVDIGELDTWVKMRVRRDADSRFNTKQNPRFIYNTTETLSIIDSGFREQWAMLKLPQGESLAVNRKNNGGRSMQAADSMVTDLYNQFMGALKADRMSGPNSAEALYTRLKGKYPNSSLTDEAGFNLSMEYINMAQDKINFYLSGRDESQLLTQPLEDNKVQTSTSKIRESVGHNFSTHGRYLQRAISLLKNYREIDSAYLQQLEAKADFLLARGFYSDVQPAITSFSAVMELAKAAYKINPDAAYNSHLLGLCFSYQMKFDSSFFYEQKALKLAPRWNKVFLTIGLNYFYQSQFDSAKIYYRRGMALDPVSPYTYNNLGNLFYVQKQFDSAEFFYRKTIAIEPKFVYAYNSLGITYYNQNQFDSAESYYRKAIAIEPKYTDAYNNLGNIYYDHNRSDSAKIYYKKAIAADPRYPYSYYNLGIIATAEKQYVLADSYFRKSIAVDPKYANSYNGLGNNFNNQRKYDSAEVYYRKVIEINPGMVYPYCNLGAIFIDKYQYDSALLYYRKAKSIDPNYAVAYVGLGNYFYDQYQYDSAGAYYRRAISIDPKYASAYNELGNNFNDQNQFDSSEFYFRKAIAINPKLIAAYNNLANNFNDQEKYDSAEINYRKAIALDPKYPDSYNFMGINLRDQKKYALAKTYFRKAIALDSRYAAAYNNLGLNYYYQNRYDSALTYYHKAMALDPKDPGVYFNLGEVLTEKNLFDSAEALYRKSIMIDPHFINAKYAYFFIACNLSLHKKINDAMDYLQVAFQRGFNDLEQMRHATDLDNIRNTPEYGQLLKKYFPDKMK